MEKNEKAEPPGERLLEFSLSSFFSKTPENYQFWKEDFSRLTSHLKIKIHRQLEQCRSLWEKFSSNNSLFNLWEFRLAWWQGFGYSPFFYTLYLDKEPVAVLPLWFNEVEGRYEWFGGTWPEDNHFFVTDEKFIPLLLTLAPSPLHLNAISPEKFKSNNFINNFQADEPKFILNLKGIKKINQYLMMLNKKARHNLRYFYQRFQNFSARLQILDGDKSNLLPKLKELSIIDFERNDISEYRKPQRMRTFEMIYKNQGKYEIKTFLVYIQNYLVSLDILAIYRNNLYILTGASDLERFSGANTFITYLEIEYGIKNKFQLIDCMQVDYHWKHKYFFKKPMLKFEKKDAATNKHFNRLNFNL